MLIDPEERIVNGNRSATVAAFVCLVVATSTLAVGASTGIPDQSIDTVTLSTSESANGTGNPFTLSVSKRVDVPDRTATFQGRQHDVTHVSRVSIGMNITATVGTNSTDPYRVYLYNSDEQVVVSKRGVSSGQFTFDTDALSSGSYLVTVYRDGDYYAIAPVVVEGYTLRIEEEGKINLTGDNLISVTLDGQESEQPPWRVSVVVANETFEERFVASERDEGRYAADIPPGRVSPGTYQVMAVAQSSEKVRGRHEPLGFSTRQLVIVGSVDATNASVTEGTRTHTSTNGTLLTPGSTSTGSTTSTEGQSGLGTIGALCALLCGLALARSYR